MRWGSAKSRADVIQYDCMAGDGKLPGAASALHQVPSRDSGLGGGEMSANKYAKKVTALFVEWPSVGSACIGTGQRELTLCDII